MRNYLLLILLFICVNVNRASGQDTSRAKRIQQIEERLGMTDEQYKTYKEKLKEYDKRFGAILNDKSLGRNERGLAMEKIFTEIKAYQQGLLEEAKIRKKSVSTLQKGPVSGQNKQ